MIMNYPTGKRFALIVIDYMGCGDIEPFG